MKQSRSTQLADAMRERRLVRFSRRFEDGHIRGYVAGIGPKWFLLALVSDRIWFDGFECFRIADIRGLATDPYTVFVEAALKKRGERKPKKPKVNLVGIKETLLSANRVSPLVTIHRENVDPDICHIGQVLSVVENHVALLEIHPDASWDTYPNDYELRQITRVSFGGDYEDALHIVGGKPNR